jgi:hypothetical protein
VEAGKMDSLAVVLLGDLTLDPSSDGILSAFLAWIHRGILTPQHHREDSFSIDVRLWLEALVHRLNFPNTPPVALDHYPMKHRFLPRRQYDESTRQNILPYSIPT